MFGKRPQIQIDGGEPAFTGVEQRLDLRIGEIGTAAVGVNGQFCVVQPQLLRADLIYPAAQPEHLCHLQKTVTAGHNKMYIMGEPVGECTEKAGGVVIRQQVKVVDEDIAVLITGQTVAQVVCQQAGTGGIGRQG